MLPDPPRSDCLGGARRDTLGEYTAALRAACALTPASAHGAHVRLLYDYTAHARYAEAAAFGREAIRAAPDEPSGWWHLAIPVLYGSARADVGKRLKLHAIQRNLATAPAARADCPRRELHLDWRPISGVVTL
eukprot:4172078-Prymnesium_polylepis.3